MMAFSWRAFDPEHYRLCYDIFEEKSGKKDLYRKWATEEFPRIVEKIFNQIQEDSIFSSLGIGSGSGDFERRLLQQLARRFGRIHHTVIEPSQPFINSYKSLVSSTSLSESNDVQLQFEWLVETIQQHMTKASSQERQYNFINAVNSLYYTDDVKKTLQFAVDRLAPNGILMVIIRSDKGTGYKLMENFPELHSAFQGNQLMNSRIIVEILSSFGMEVTTQSLRANVDFSCVFEEGNEDRRYLLDIYTGAQDFLDSAPEEFSQRVLDFIRSECFSVNNGNRDQLFTPMEWDVIVTSKSLKLEA